MIAEKWKLNEVISATISQHHGAAEHRGSAEVQIAFVALGNIYSNIFDLGYAGDPFPLETELESNLDIVGLSLDEFGAIGGSVQEEIRKAQIFLQM